MRATSSTARKNDAWFAFEGLLNPLIFLTNWSAAARISSSVLGGSKLKSVLMFLHICLDANKKALKLCCRIVGSGKLNLSDEESTYRL